MAADLDAGAPARTAPAATFNLPGYSLVRELHRGGQGVVYLAIQHATKRKVALKVMREGPFADAGTKRRFEREIELVSSLDHPYIVRVYDSGVSGGVYYFAMEYVSGAVLDEHLRTRNPATRERLELFAKICEGVSYAHRRGIIHRDLKPSNIRVDDRGDPRVLDFGLARHETADVMDGGASMRLVSVTGQFIGTLPYMSPEQTLGRAGAVDIRSDVYTLGVILYQTLTGRFPYDVEGQVSEVLRNITDVPPQRPSAVGVRVNHELETILFKAMAKEPLRRYQSAGELERDIRHHLAGEPIEARRDSSLYVLSKLMARHRGAAAAAAGFVLLVSGFAVAMSVLYARADRARVLADAARAESHEHLGLAHAGMRFFIEDVDHAIAALAGSTPVRRDLLHKAMAHYERFARGAAGDPSLRRELAAAYESMADVSVKLAEADRAATLLDDALALRKALFDERADADSRRDLARCLMLIGDAKATGEREAARGQYQAAIDLLSGAAPTSDPAATAILAASLSKQGEVLNRLDRLEEAEDRLQRAIDLQRGLCDREPSNVDFRRELGHSHYRLGAFLTVRFAARAAAARAAHAAAFDIFKNLYEQAPHDVQVARAFVLALNQKARFEIADGRPDAAIAALEESLRLREKLAATDPSNAELQRDVALACLKIGELHFGAQRFDEARGPFDRFALIAGQLAEKEPGSLRRRSDLAAAHCKQGELAIQQRRFDDAARDFERMLRMLIALAEADPGNADRESSVSGGHCQVSEACRFGGDLKRAQHHARLALAIDERLADAAPGDPLRQTNLAATLNCLAHCAAAMEDWPSARAFLTRGRDVVKRLRTLYPNSAEYETLLANAEKELAELDQRERAAGSAQAP